MAGEPGSWFKRIDPDVAAKNSYDSWREEQRVEKERREGRLPRVEPTPYQRVDAAREHARAARAAADLSALPVDVRQAAGMATTSARDLHAAARAEWQAVRASLPADVRDAIEATTPLPPRPATADALVQRAAAMRARVSGGAGQPLDLVQILESMWRPGKERTIETAPEWDYEYARGTWAQEAVEESADTSASDLYISAMQEGRFAGDMMPGLELPGALFGGRRTCGLPTVLGCRGEHEGCTHRGKLVATRGEMTCRGRPCLRCFKAWCAKEADSMADKLSAGLLRAHLAESGAPGGRRVVVIHLAISLPPSEKIAWASGPKERARIRRAVKAELDRRGRWFGYSLSDHSYRFTADLESAYLSPHFHAFAIGWLDYQVSADRFQEFKDVPYTVQTVTVKGKGTGLDAVPTLATRVRGRCRGIFVKHLSTLETYQDIWQACYYVNTHGTASARRLGESGGGEHATRWFGQLGNGRAAVEAVSRYESDVLAGDFSNTPLPDIVDGITIWSAEAEADGTLSTVTPTHAYTGRGHDASMAALHSAIESTQRAYPATAKFEGMLREGVVAQAGVDGPQVCQFEEPALTESEYVPPDRYVLAHVQGRVRTAAAVIPASADAPARRMTPEEAVRGGHIKEKSRWIAIRVHSRTSHLCIACGHRLGQVVWDPGGQSNPMLPLNVSEGLGIVTLDVQNEDDQAEQRMPGRKWIVMDVRGKYQDVAPVDFEWLTAREWMQITHTPHLPAWDGAGILMTDDGVWLRPPHMDALDVQVQRYVTADLLYSLVRAEYQQKKDDAYARGTWFHFSKQDIKDRVATMYVQQQAATGTL